MGIDFVLSLGKDADDGVAPIGIRSISVGDDSGLRFVGELSVLIEVDAGDIELGGERDDRSGVARIDATPRSVERV